MPDQVPDLIATIPLAKHGRLLLFLDAPTERHNYGSVTIQYQIAWTIPPRGPGVSIPVSPAGISVG